jgi:hypothetical protein
MTDELAERLLVKVLDWNAEEVRAHLANIQALATWKYDGYERFGHGRRFVESLALWLDQFETTEERRAAFDFVRRRLIYISEPEMIHLVEMAYPDFIRPYLLRRIAEEAGQPLRQPRELAMRTEFLVRQRQCLFLGLSDGARTDIFRRSNSPDLTHEQILLTSEVEKGRAKKLLSELEKGLRQITGAAVPSDMVKFRTVVLLDDFTGSGLSYLRIENHKSSGKIARFSKNLFGGNNLLEKSAYVCKRLIGLRSPTASLFDSSKLEILVVLYTGTHQARAHLDGEMEKLRKRHGIRCEVIFVQQFDNLLSMRPNCNDPMAPLIEKYYDKGIEDDHTNVGGTNVKYGFATCGLPLVLPHNTPNNSLALLWAETDKVRALFPRVQRHRKQV